MSKARLAAMERLSHLPASVREDIALVIETAETQGEYQFDGEGSVWEDDVNQTLYALAQEIRKL